MAPEEIMLLLMLSCTPVVIWLTAYFIIRNLEKLIKMIIIVIAAIVAFINWRVVKAEKAMKEINETL
jgi:hypothetical protein